MVASRLSCLACLAPLEHVRLSCLALFSNVRSQRAPHSPKHSDLHVRLARTSFRKPLSHHSPQYSHVRFSTRPLLYTCASQHVRCLPSSLSLSLTSTHRTLSLSCASRARALTFPSPRTELHERFLHTSSPHCAPLSSGRVATVSANRERTRCPSPLPFLASEKPAGR